MKWGNIKEGVLLFLGIFILFSLLIFFLFGWGMILNKLDKVIFSESLIEEELPIIKKYIICYEKEHIIYYVWDYKNNILYNETYDLGYTWEKIECPGNLKNWWVEDMEE